MAIKNGYPSATAESSSTNALGDPTQVQNKVNSLLSGNTSSNIVEQFTTLSADGKWGPAVTTRLQEYHDTYKDGKVSHQYKEACNTNLYSAQFDTKLIGSDLIRAIQKGLKTKGTTIKLSLGLSSQYNKRYHATN